MLRSILLLLAGSALGAHAALTLVAREPFVGPGTLTSSSPGSNFSSVSGTFTMVRAGPRTSAIAAPGWSADIRTTGAPNYRGTMNLSGAASTCGMWGVWVRIKSLPGPGNYLSVLQLIDQTNNVVADFKLDPSGVISVIAYNAGGTSPTFTSPPIATNTWTWLAVAWQIQAGNKFPYGIRCMSMPLGGSLATWGSADGLNAQALFFNAVNVGLQTGGNGPMLRIGCPSLYSMSSFADIAYPSDIIPPVEQTNNWYVNTTTGNDSNDGSTPSTAWKTAAKIAVESQYCGMLDSNAPGPGGGDTLTINTSGAPLVLGTTTLAFSTQGLKVQPASGQTYIKCQAEEFLANSGFTHTAGLSKTYQTPDTQANVVAWENDEWMWHVKAASFNSAAAITNPQTLQTTNFASAGAALDATPGSFYTDGTNLYIHPFNDTNPATDGQVYTRSINRGGGLAAVEFTAGNFRAIGFNVHKTTLVDANDNDFGAYCFQDGVLSGTGFSSSVEGGYFAYGDKHCFGSTTGVTNSSLLVLNTECEQGHPYCGYGGQTPFVSYTGVTTGDVIHTYKGCTCLARSGLIGSTAGDPIGTGGDIVLSHNNGTGISFGSITLNNCNFASGSINISVTNSLTITGGTKTTLVYTGCPTTTIQQTTFTYEGVQMENGSDTLVMQNCLLKPVFALGPSHPTYYGLLLKGNATIEGCTFDLAGLTGDSSTYFPLAYIQRTSALNLTFRNNAYVVPTGENFPLLDGPTNEDGMTFDHNAYNLGSGTALVRGYNGYSTATLTFAQWQALGQDCVNSTLNANLLLQNDVPQSGSPLFNAGIDLGSGPDITGTVYTHRNTIGAYEGSTTYRAPQSISGFPPILTTTNSTQLALPAKTSAGLAITYTVVSGPARISGTTLIFTGDGPVVIRATQAGNGSNAPLTAIETVIVTQPAYDTPAMPSWTLALMGAALAFAAARSLRMVRV